MTGAALQRKAFATRREGSAGVNAFFAWCPGACGNTCQTQISTPAWGQNDSHSHAVSTYRSSLVLSSVVLAFVSSVGTQRQALPSLALGEDASEKKTLRLFSASLRRSSPAD